MTSRFFVIQQIGPFDNPIASLVVLTSINKSVSSRENPGTTSGDPVEVMALSCDGEHRARGEAQGCTIDGNIKRFEVSNGSISLSIR